MQLNKQRDCAITVFNEMKIIFARELHTATFLWKHLMENKALRYILKYSKIVKQNQNKPKGIA